MDPVSQMPAILDIFEDASALPGTLDAPSSPDAHTSIILGELDIHQIVNLQSTSSADSLVRRLDNFHISSQKKKRPAANAKPPQTKPANVASFPLSAAPKRPQIDENTFLPPHADSAPKAPSAPTGCAVTTSVTPTTRAVVDQWQKHEAGQFEYLLSLPASSAAAEKYSNDCGKPAPAEHDQKLYFGCNLLETRPSSRLSSLPTSETESGPVYTLLATPIDHPEQVSVDTWAESEMMTAMETPENTIIAALEQDHESLSEDAPKDNKSIMTPLSLPVVPSPRVDRIEDSLEALDELEEQLEELDKMVCVERIPSPEKMRRTASVKQTTLKRSTSTTTKPISRTGSLRCAATDVSRTGTVRRQTMSTVKETQKPASGSPVAARRDVTRPASLLPPKPPAKSSKPTTQPAFELPGDAVARRLKEQREARLARANEKAATDATPQRSRSTRKPTVPTFELPGEAISRRKREEHQAKLRAQEEEERKRREFKARPIRGAAPSSFPRDTATSRARQSLKPAVDASAASPPKKRFSVAGGGNSPSRRTLNSSESSQPGRGREDVAGSSSNQLRAASTSTGSTSVSKGSSGVSAEDLQMQRRRGREIFKRDNSIAEERGSEQKEREFMAKVARQQAAERSRQLSREWAEKRQSKRMSMLMPSASPVPGAARDIAAR